MRGIAVLGPIRLVGDDGHSLALGSRRQALLLAILVSRLGSMVSADELVEALWGEKLPDHPTAALQSQVFRLRRQLGAVDIDLRSEGSGYRLASDRNRIDVTRFEDLVAEAEGCGSPPETALRLLDEAVGLWRDRPYLEVADHDAVMAEAVRLEEVRAAAAETRGELLLALGHRNQAAQSMERLARDHPFRERPVAIQMRALAQQGRHADALGVFQSFRRTLSEELGLEPSPALRELEGEILRHDQPARPRIGLPGNSFVGREVELAAVVDHFGTSRLLTLIGPGGIGKTRLAAHAAARLEDRYPDGVWLCELANVGADAVALAIASALQVERDADHSDAERIVQFLKVRRALLVVDNCEHVVRGAGRLITAVLVGAPEVDVLATSRRRLGVEGEHVLPVSPLPVAGGEEDDSPAVALFLDRAEAIRPGCTVDPSNRPAVRELCRRLGGLPLALELAAALTASRTPAEILEELADRVDRLADAYRVRERHRSIDAVVGWSYGLLDSTEQHVFRHSSVFAGGFVAAAMSAVAQADRYEVRDSLAALVEHSLLAAHDVGATARFAVLEPIRQFAEARLKDRDGLHGARSRHARWAAAWVEAADAGLRRADEARWALAVASEMANLRAAHRWALDHEPDTAMRIAGSMYWYACWYGASEVFDWAAATLTVATDGPTPVMPSVWATAALGACRRGELAAARRLAEKGIAAAGDNPGAARLAWEALSSTEMMSGHYEEALVCHQHALQGARLAGDAVQQSREQAARALALGYLGRVEPATVELEAATTVAADTGNPTVQGFCDYVRGEICIDRDPPSALACFQRARDQGRVLGNRYLTAIAGVSAVSCAARMANPARSLEAYVELLDHFERTGSRAQQWTTIRTLIEVLTRVGRDEAAAVLYGALVSSPTALPLIGADAERVEEAVGTLTVRLGGERFERMKVKGAALGDERAIVYAADCARRVG